MIKRVVLSILGMSLLASPVFAGGAPVLKDQKARDSYSLGYEFGHNISGQGVELDTDILLSAIRDALEGKKPALSEQLIRETVDDMRQRSREFQTKQARDRAAANLEEAKAFLEENGRKPGVVTLPSGLEYRVLRQGAGAGPKATDGVRVRYRGTLVNGTEFDNIMNQPESNVPVIPVSGANRGWSEALQLMRPGAKWVVYVPPALGFGDRPYGRIPANSVLVYELDLLSVVSRRPATQEQKEN